MLLEDNRSSMINVVICFDANPQLKRKKILKTVSHFYRFNYKHQIKTICNLGSDKSLGTWTKMFFKWYYYVIKSTTFKKIKYFCLCYERKITDRILIILDIHQGYPIIIVIRHFIFFEKHKNCSITQPTFSIFIHINETKCVWVCMCVRV